MKTVKAVVLILVLDSGVSGIITGLIDEEHSQKDFFFMIPHVKQLEKLSTNDNLFLLLKQGKQLKLNMAEVFVVLSTTSLPVPQNNMCYFNSISTPLSICGWFQCWICLTVALNDRCQWLEILNKEIHEKIKLGQKWLPFNKLARGRSCC